MKTQNYLHVKVQSNEESEIYLLNELEKRLDKNRNELIKLKFLAKQELEIQSLRNFLNLKY